MNKTHVYATTIHRGAPLKKGGQIIKIDWTNKRILAKSPIIPTHPKITLHNPRGGVRGGRGIVKIGNEIYAASYHSIHVFDTYLNHKRDIHNKNFAGIHEMETDGKYIFVTSTKIDTVVKITLDGKTKKIWSLRDNNKIQKKLNTSPIYIDPTADNRKKFLTKIMLREDPGHLHLNAIYVDNNYLYTVLNARGAILRLPDYKIFFQNSSIKGCHNLIKTLSGDFIICDSKHKQLKVLSNKGELIKSINLLNSNKILYKYYKSILMHYLKAAMGLNKKISSSFFIRGLTLLSKNEVLVGVAPAGIMKVNLETDKVTDSFFTTKDINKSIHGLLATFD